MIALDIQEALKQLANSPGYTSGEFAGIPVATITPSDELPEQEIPEQEIPDYRKNCVALVFAGRVFPLISLHEQLDNCLYNYAATIEFTMDRYNWLREITKKAANIDGAVVQCYPSAPPRKVLELHQCLITHLSADQPTSHSVNINSRYMLTSHATPTLQQTIKLHFISNNTVKVR